MRNKCRVLIQAWLKNPRARWLATFGFEEQGDESDGEEAKSAVSGAAEEAADEDEEAEAEKLPFKVGAKTYFRIGVKAEDGTIAWSTADLWTHKKDGSVGDYVGALIEGGGIDLDAEPPLGA